MSSKKILLIATGGTIASKKTENGLTPKITPEELLSYVPDAEDYCKIKSGYAPICPAVINKRLL